MQLLLKGRTRSYLVTITSILVLSFLFFAVSCARRDGENTIRQFFSLLNATEYNAVLALTEGNAERIMKKITKEQPQEIVDIVFENLILDKISKDELLASLEKESWVFRVNYHLKLEDRDNNINPEMKRALMQIKNGEASFYINKKTKKNNKHC